MKSFGQDLRWFLEADQGCFVGGRGYLNPAEELGAFVGFEFSSDDLQEVDLPSPFRPTMKMRSLRSICKVARSRRSGPPKALLIC